MEIIWSDDEQKFITMPDGDTATHFEIKEYYESKTKKIVANISVNYKTSIKGRNKCQNQNTYL